MRTHNTKRDTPDRIESAFIRIDSRPAARKSASIHLLNPSNSLGQHRSARRARGPSTLQNETAELLADIEGLPILVRLLVQHVPGETRSGRVCTGAEINSLLSSTLERMVERMRESPPRHDARSKLPLAIVETVAGEEESLVRLPAASNETVLRVGPLELDLLDRTAKRGDRQIDLRPREFRLLKYMMERSDKLLTRAILLKEVWHYKFVPETNLVDVHMGRLRRKVDAPNESPMIRNVRGVGFVLSATPLSQGSPPRPAERPANLAVADRRPQPVERTVQ
jgi:DNA-binding winged helix-turn-helix (wHTH) protein